MRDFISVQSYYDVWKKGSLKQDALLFDKIHLNFRAQTPSLFDEEDIEREKYLLIEFDWLEEKKILIRHDFGADPILGPDFSDSPTIIDLISEYTSTHTDGVMLEILKWKSEKENRMFADYHLREPNNEVTVLSDLTTNFGASEVIDKENIVNLAVAFLPVPDEKTSWEQILDFRSDPDSKAKYLDLRNWMNETARGDLTPKEVEEKLEYLLSQYERHMAIHKMQLQRGTFETSTVTVLEVIENLVKFKWSKIAKSFFKIQQQKAKLFRAELTAPGNAIAYISKTRNTFG